MKLNKKNKDCYPKKIIWIKKRNFILKILKIFIIKKFLNIQTNQKTMKLFE